MNGNWQDGGDEEWWKERQEGQFREEGRLGRRRVASRCHGDRLHCMAAGFLPFVREIKWDLNCLLVKYKDKKTVHRRITLFRNLKLI